jgi:DNA replication protein DnaC
MPNPTATAAVLVERCQELKLPTVLRELKGAARSAQDGSWSFELFLAELLEREVIQRRANSAKLRIRQARFPDTKTLDQLDYSALQGVSKTKIQALSSGQFIADAEDVIIIGPIGTAKTHLAIGLGVEAARRRKHVAFVRAADLVWSQRSKSDPPQRSESDPPWAVRSCCETFGGQVGKQVSWRVAYLW